MKICEKCGDEIGTKDGDNRCTRCEDGRKPKTSTANRKAREDILRSCGLTKVRGALGGVYWE